ncbi:(2Fe-2S)-binding protein [Alicyclobacillus acidoterrestris]|uniref:(2Fe-2S)-binding protein n=2 Tax=Alicyclobacillus acidoterrestris TaxID=1450 RepID=T0DTQ7_ALIAG|nr:(2Fe-2S)-binding protein [Alicyclobacillus acidoterrestris]EPZ52856.1 hypothetical protein N007_19300 [Alicyclobacillus acidoterrestris ATCC 49025]UNO47832.1 (2Fe-2S)-binding protein [Alicyclobacillus acidoterrestris]GEO27605.1 (2Fe-2S)-binding protein [Alicyclobacillus acidoterrestris]
MAKHEVTLHINGEDRTLVIRHADTLLDVLRLQCGLTGAKPGCENGDCGACTVIVDDLPYKSCIMLAIEATGHAITTIEGLENSPVQRAFARCYAFQCGYCTPGFIMNAHAMLEHATSIDKPTIQEWLESNICRCTSYEEIASAIRMALSTMNATFPDDCERDSLST